MHKTCFNDFTKPAMAAGSYMWNGVAVVISPNVPLFHAADKLDWREPRWLWAILWKLFGVRRFRPGERVMEEQVLWQGAAQKVFMSPAMWERVKNCKAIVNR